MNTLLDELRRRGWEVRETDGSRALLPAELCVRYGDVPPAMRMLLGAVDRCARADGQAWFITGADYHGVSDTAFAWNEVEVMSRDAADGDAAGQLVVSRFWDAHIPFMLATHSDYDYLAVRVADGAVVHGYAPEWEEAALVAPNFDAFLERLRGHLDGVGDPTLEVFFGPG